MWINETLSKIIYTILGACEAEMCTIFHQVENYMLINIVQRIGFVLFIVSQADFMEMKIHALNKELQEYFGIFYNSQQISSLLTNF